MVCMKPFFSFGNVVYTDAASLLRSVSPFKLRCRSVSTFFWLQLCRKFFRNRFYLVAVK